KFGIDKLAQAWELMARALAAGLTELSAGALEQAGLTAHEFEVLSPGDLGRRLFVEKPAPAVEPQAVRPATVQDEPRATGALLQVQQTLAELLGERTADAIDPATNFQNLGLDSLMLIRLREQLNTRLRAKLTTATLYSYPTSRLLAEHITEQLRTKTEPASSNEGDAARSAEPPGLATAVAEPPAGPLGIEVMDDLAQAERLADELLRELGLR
ncbi:MAG: hypothetical protein EOO70_07565, partial [Myxococcaceae bacterium]